MPATTTTSPPASTRVIQNLALAYRTFDLKWDEPDGGRDGARGGNAPARRRSGCRAAGEAWRPADRWRRSRPSGIRFLRHHRADAAAVHAPGRCGVEDRRPHLLGEARPATRWTGNFSGKPDDRWAFTTKSGMLHYRRRGVAGRSRAVLKGWDDPLAKECLDAAVKLYAENARIRHRPAGRRRSAVRRRGSTGSAGRRGGRRARYRPPAGGRTVADLRRPAQDWTAALELMIATNGADPYKTRVQELFPTCAAAHRAKRLDGRSRPAVPGREFQDAARGSGEDVHGGAGQDLAATPFGVPPSWRLGRVGQRGRLRPGCTSCTRRFRRS